MTSPIGSTTNTPISSVNGLASGVQWQGMIDQIMQLEQQRTLDPVTAQQTAVQQQNAAWTQFQALSAKLRDAGSAVRDPASFDVFTASATKSPTTGQDLLSASAASGASPGTYGVEVLSVAQSEKLSGAVASDSSTALGISGQISLNGKAITIVAGDTLSSLRDKINAVNAGTSPSGVSATILSGAAGARLVLTSDQTGAAGIEMVDDGNGTLQALGLADGTTLANITATGATQTNRLASTTAAIATLLGIPLPAPTTVKVGGQIISVDFSVDSLATIAAKINAATGNPAAASVKSETVGTQTFYRLVTDAAVETDGSGNAATSARALAVLGFTQTGLGGETQVVKSANTFADASSGLGATASTLLTNLQVNGQSLGLGAGDTVRIAGTRGDGAAVSRTFAIGAGSTVQNLLDAINNAGSGFGAGTRTAVASITGGRIALTDSQSGDSQLGLALTVNKSGGGTISLGAFSTTNGGTVGRSRELAAGTDATIRVDGQVVTSATNTVSSAIAGVTLNLLGADPGATVNVSVGRNTDAIAQKLQDFAAAYNAVKSFITTNTAAGAPLANDSTIRSMGSTLTTALVQPVSGLTGTYTSAVLAGLQHDANGVLSLDKTTFAAALQTNFDAVKKLFTLTGVPTDSEVSFVSAGSAAKASTSPWAVAITQAATTASVTGSSWTTYATSGTPDTMSFTDVATGVSGSIALANGDTIDAVVQKLNSLFGSAGVHASASKTVDNRLKITGSDFGSSAGFTVAFTPGTGGNGTAALGIAAQAYNGLDVAGLINGTIATGRGQFLTGATGDASEGVILQYTGTTARGAGTVALSLGVGGTLFQTASSLATDTTGSVAEEVSATQARSDALAARVADIQQRLDARRASLTQQFVAMETAMSQAQSIGAALTAQINGLQSNTR